MTKLKPCPFCGNEDIRLMHYMVKGDWWYVGCPECHIAMDPWVFGEQTREEAIERWNRRV